MPKISCLKYIIRTTKLGAAVSIYEKFGDLNLVFFIVTQIRTTPHQLDDCFIECNRIRILATFRFEIRFLDSFMIIYWREIFPKRYESKPVLESDSPDRRSRMANYIASFGVTLRSTKSNPNVSLQPVRRVVSAINHLKLPPHIPG